MQRLFMSNLKQGWIRILVVWLCVILPLGEMAAEDWRFPNTTRGPRGEPPPALPGPPGMPRSAPDQRVSGVPGGSRVEIVLNNPQPYVQETVLLTLRVVGGGEFKTLTPELPNSERVIYQRLQNPSTSLRADTRGQRESVTEFLYAVTPILPGNLDLGAIRVQATFTERGSYWAAPREASTTLWSPPLHLAIKPAVEQIQDWRPLRQLDVRVTMDNKPVIRGKAAEVKVGTPLALRVEFTAVGATGQQLPSMAAQLKSNEFRVYPEKTETEGGVSPDGNLLGKRVEIFTLVPQVAGTLLTPEIRIPWWNTQSGTPQLAVAPIHSIQVTGGPIGKGHFGSLQTGGFFPAGSPVAFWLPLVGTLMFLSGIWLYAWVYGKNRRPTRVRAADQAVQSEGRWEALRTFMNPLIQAWMILNPLRRWQALRMSLIMSLPISVRFWYCVRYIDQEDDPAVWGPTLKFLACKHLDMSPYASFQEMAGRIVRYIPNTDSHRIRSLMSDLDAILYGLQASDFASWKRAFKREVRPRLLGGGSLRWRVTDHALPDLNPRG
ncbi:putative Protein BatD [Gammaproteobacteria bacterium]